MRLAFSLLMVGALACGSETERGRSGEAVDISIVYSGASAAEIESSIVVPVEAAINALKNVKSITSRIDEGHALVSVEVGNADVAIRELRDVLSASARDLPPAAELPVIRRRSGPAVLTVSVDGTRSPESLAKIARDRIRMRLLRIAGVAEIDMNGVPESVIEIRPDLARLAATDLTLKQLGDAIQTSSLDLPSGRLDQRDVTIKVSSHDPAALASIVVGQHNGASIRLGDVATVAEALERVGTASSPTLAVHLQRGAEVTRTVAAVRAALAEIRAEMPAGVTITDAPTPPPPVRFVVWFRGPDLNVLDGLADALEVDLRGRAVTDVLRDPPAGAPTFNVVPDRARAGELGVSLQEVSAAIRALAGVEVGTVTKNGETHAIKLRLPTADVPALIASIYVRASSGLVPLAEVAQITRELAPAIVRRDRERAVGISFADAAARSIGRKVITEARAKLPVGYAVELSP